MRSLHLELLVGHTPGAAATATGTVSTVLVVVLLRVVLATGEAPPTQRPGQRTAFQIQVLLACV